MADGAGRRRGGRRVRRRRSARAVATCVRGLGRYRRRRSRDGDRSRRAAERLHQRVGTATREGRAVSATIGRTISESTATFAPPPAPPAGAPNVVVIVLDDLG